MRFHIPSIPHTVTSKEHSACAFTQNIVNFCAMMSRRGHEIIHYGHRNSVVECAELVPVVEPETYDTLYGNVHDIRNHQYVTHGDDHPLNALISGNTIYEISKRKRPGDYLLIFGGFWNKKIADAHGDMIVVEPAIGYPSSFSNFKVYPSYAYLHSFVQDANLPVNHYHVVIPHYFDVDDFDPHQPKEDYFLFVGRLNFDKGITLAIDLTAKIGARLKVCGQGNFQALGYAQIPDHVDFVGYVGVEKRKELMAKAKCVIMPTIYMEPFGCVVIESLLSGTPVLTHDWGGPGENNLHGVTGFKCRTFEQFEWAARNIHLIEPRKCREWAEKNFSFDKIGLMYEEYFQSLQGLDWYKPNPSRTNLEHLAKHYPTSDAGYHNAKIRNLLPKDGERAEVGPAYYNRWTKHTQTRNPYSIVVAKYNENIEWTKELDNVIIYDKSVPPLKNIGREAETFLRYIIEHYNNLPEYVIFLQGNPYDTMWSGTSVKDGIKPPDTACPFVAPWREDPINKWPETYYYRDYHFLLFGEHYTESTIRFSTGAQWSVPRHCITHRPLDFYRKLHRMISKAGNPTYEDVRARNFYDKHSIDAWILERLWAPIFNMHVPTSREFISKYSFSHLTQDSTQKVIGPIQDDEALMLYSIIRGNRMTRILEIGGLSGYSACNFIEALEYSPDGILYTVDIQPVPTMAKNHKVIVKDVNELTPHDIDNSPLDLVFFDCHSDIQRNVFVNFLDQGLITYDTVIALHDTNLHWSPDSEIGIIHQPIERNMMLWFKDMGYQIFSIRTSRDKHSESFPFRHGLTVCQLHKQ